jgi:hypothetical protein
MAEPINIDNQVAALEVAILNKRGHLETLEDLVRKGKRPAHETELVRDSIPPLEAALNTLKTVQKHKEEWRECLRAIYVAKEKAA